MDFLFQNDSPVNQPFERFFQLLDRHPWIWVLFLLALNLTTKLWNLTDMSLHLDEAAHVFHAQKPLGDLIRFSAQDPNPPLYNILIGIWVRIFGVDVGSIRGFAVIFSTAAVVVLFFFARKFLNVKTGVFATLLISVSSIHMFYAHDARVYPLVLFLTCSSFYVYLRVLEKPNAGTFVAAILVNAALLYTHYVPVFALFVQFLYSHLYLKKNRKGFVYYYVSQVFVLLLVLPWVAYNYMHMSAGKVDDWLMVPDWGTVRYIYNQYAGSTEVLYLFMGVLAVFGTWFLVRMLRRKTGGEEKARSGLLFMWAFVPVIVDFVVSNLVFPAFHQRYLLYTTLGLFLLVGYWISISKLGNVVQWILVGGLFVTMLTALNLNPSKYEDWKGAAAQAREWEVPHETAIILSPDYQGTSFAYYYDRSIYEDFENLHERLNQADIYLTWKDEVFERYDLSGYKHIILVSSHENVVDPNRELFKVLNEKACFRESKFLEGVHLYRFEMEPCERQVGHRIFLDFDDPTQWKYEDRILKTDKAYSGNYVSPIDPEHEYSAEYREEIGKISGEHVSLLMINFQGFAVSEDPECTLVVSVEDSTGGYIYQPYYLRHRLETNEWKEVSLLTNIPEIRSPQDELLIFVWNPKQKTVYFDNFEIQVME